MPVSQSPEFRNTYFVTGGLALIALLLVRFLVIPVESAGVAGKDTWGAINDSLIAAVVTSLGLGVALVLLGPRVSQPPLRTIPPQQLDRTLRKEAKTADSWSVRARTANYFSRVTLPILITQSLVENRGVDIQMLMLNPDRKSLLERYVDFRRASATVDNQWSVDRVKHEIYASLLAVLSEQKRNPRARICVGFSREFWSLSIDMSNKLIVLTGQNKGDPGVVVDLESAHFHAWTDEYDALFSMSKNAFLYQFNENAPDSIDQKSESWFNQALQKLGLSPVDTDTFEEVLKIKAQPHNYS